MRTFDLDQFWPIPLDAARAPASTADVAARNRDYIAERLRSAAVSAVWSHPTFEPAASVAARRDEPGDNIPGRSAFEQSAFDQRAFDRSALEQLRQASALIGRRSAAFFATFDPKAAVWLSMGFMAGMVSWHAVGFWGFVSQAVLNGSERSVQMVSRDQPRSVRTVAVALPSIVTGSITPASTPAAAAPAGICMELVFNRTSGVTSAAACSGDSQPFRDAGRGKRADRMPTVDDRLQDKKVWTASTAVDSAAPAGSPAAAPKPPAEAGLDLTRFDLTIRPTP